MENDGAIQLTKEKSEEVASMIEAIKGLLHFLDTDYCIAAVVAFRRQASMQDSMSILKPGYDFNQTRLLQQKADALEHLAKFIQALKECDELKLKIQENGAAFEKINKMFM